MRHKIKMCVCKDNELKYYTHYVVSTKFLDVCKRISSFLYNNRVQSLLGPGLFYYWWSLRKNILPYFHCK